MAGILLSLLWALFWAICGAGVVWLLIYGVKQFLFDISGKIEQGIWFLYFLLVIIFLITTFAGGGHTSVPHPF